MNGFARQPRALIVEDEGPTRELLRLHLGLAGFSVDEADDGCAALDRTRSTPFDLVVLDLMLPRIDGITVCRSMRSGRVNREVPILILTARDTESDKVLGLESGADDYMTKPFGVRELLARVGAITRRNRRDQPSEAARRVASHAVELDGERRQALVRGSRIELTKQEFDLLYLLAARPGIVFSRSAILAHVSGGDTYVTERTIDTVVSRLRRKIEVEPQNPELLLTAWGVGYKFAEV
jgi:two-component system, OmpR family, alkaline phosphatase synthesis response regulator PhoP